MGLFCLYTNRRLQQSGFLFGLGEGTLEQFQPLMDSVALDHQGKLFLREKDYNIMIDGSICVRPVAFLGLDLESGLLK
jgi:hypothetical protein